VRNGEKEDIYSFDVFQDEVAIQHPFVL